MTQVPVHSLLLDRRPEKRCLAKGSDFIDLIYYNQKGSKVKDYK